MLKDKKFDKQRFCININSYFHTRLKKFRSENTFDQKSPDWTIPQVGKSHYPLLLAYQSDVTFEMSKFEISIQVHELKNWKRGFIISILLSYSLYIFHYPPWNVSKMGRVMKPGPGIFKLENQLLPTPLRIFSCFIPNLQI